MYLEVVLYIVVKICEVMSHYRVFATCPCIIVVLRFYMMCLLHHWASALQRSLSDLVCGLRPYRDPLVI